MLCVSYLLCWSMRNPGVFVWPLLIFSWTKLEPIFDTHSSIFHHGLIQGLWEHRFWIVPWFEAILAKLKPWMVNLFIIGSKHTRQNLIATSLFTALRGAVTNWPVWLLLLLGQPFSFCQHETQASCRPFCQVANNQGGHKCVKQR